MIFVECYKCKEICSIPVNQKPKENEKYICKGCEENDKS